MRGSSYGWLEKIDCRANGEAVFGKTIPLHLLGIKNVLKKGAVHHDPNSKWAQNRIKRKKRKKMLKIKHPIKPEDFGHIISDTVMRVTDGVKDCPKINTYIERYNRTVEEEFIDNNLDVIYDKPLFNQRLAEYLIFYNAQRPHKSLGLKSPLGYLIENGGMSHMYLTYTRH